MSRASRIILSSPLLLLLIAGAHSGCGSSSGGPTGAGGKGGSTGSAGTGSAGTGSAGTGSAGTGSAGTGTAGTGAAGTGSAGTGSAGTGSAGTGAAGTGAAGTGSDGGAGTGAAGTGSDAAAGSNGNPDAAGGDAPAGKTAVAMITPFGEGTVKGTATFTQVGINVQLKVDLTNCPAGVHPLHIHEGTGCATMAEQGMHWSPPRGENIGPTGEITCAVDMTGTLTYTRMGTDAATRWTLGDGTATDAVGHPIVIHGPGTGSTLRSGCGVIKLQ